jgi:predicted kinase
MKELFLLRGLPGSGKSTLAKSIGGKHLEADMYHINKDGVYDWKPEKVKDAHEWCQFECGRAMAWELKVVVSNTFTQEWEMQPYLDLAEKHGYKVYCLVVENRHGGVNEHNVPEETLEKMKNRFDLKLI